MGYMSEVALTIRNEDYVKMVEQIDSILLDELDRAKATFSNDYTTLHWECIKWYSSFEMVKFIESFIANIPHVFHRLGEEDDDYERPEICLDDEGNDYYDMFDEVSFIRELVVN